MISSHQRKILLEDVAETVKQAGILNSAFSVLVECSSLLSIFFSCKAYYKILQNPFSGLFIWLIAGTCLYCSITFYKLGKSCFVEHMVLRQNMLDRLHKNER